MLFPCSFVTQPSPSTSSDNPWKLIFSTTILINSVSLLFCTLIGFLQLRHRTHFRDSFCLAIIIIIIINEKINVAFSRRTARTRNSHKKHKLRKRRV